MGSSEFELINRYFTRSAPGRSGIVLGIGDDAAILQVPPGAELIASMDTLVEGVHFPPDTDAGSIGYKSLAVNLSDLAAMGAEPAWAMLSLTLPAADERWLAAFSSGFFELAQEYNVALIGGDTTRGPLAITVQIQGFTPPGAAYRRSGAQPGDLIYVTGTLGDAGLALMRGRDAGDCGASAHRFLAERLNRPRPRVREALCTRGMVHAAIDISDGLVADLGHVLQASGVGARLALDRLPLSGEFQSCLDAMTAAAHAGLGQFAPGLAWAELALTSGDDYELCLTVAPGQRHRVEAALADTGTRCTCIGVIEAAPGLRCELAGGTPYIPGRGGYDHFSDSDP